jgi:hypothetical protein
MRDEAFALRLRQRFLSGQALTLDAAKIEGASMLRDVCRILQSILSIALDYDEHHDSTSSSSESIISTRSTIKLKDTIKDAKGAAEANAEDLIMKVFRDRLNHMENFCAITKTPSLLIELLAGLLNSGLGTKIFLKEVCK